MMVRGFLQTPVPNNVAYSPSTIAQGIAEGLQSIGHDVTFFGPDGTKLNVAHVETGALRPVVKTQTEFDDFVSSNDLFEGYRPGLYDNVLAKLMLQRAAKKEFDCVVFHHFESVLPIADLFPSVPIVHILHDYIDEHRRQMLEIHSSPNQHFISISNSQRRDAPDLNYAATIYNGIDTKHFAPNGEHEDYLMISGRITPEKGIKEAVQVALQTNHKLLIAGSLSKNNGWYFDEHIKPYLNNHILFLGMLDKEQLVKYYQKAAGLLVPVQWQEPFGLTMAEAGACGTPVIAFNRGAVPEVIVHGKTGFIVNNSAEMIMAVEKLSSIKQKDCRDHVVKNFSLENMVENYSRVLEDIVSSSTTKSPQNAIIDPVRLIPKKLAKISRKILG